MNDYTYHNIEDLNVRKVEQIINFKPVVPQFVMMVCGFLLFFVQNLYSKCLGFFFIFFSIVVQLFVKDHKVMSVSGSNIIFYHPDNDKKVFVVNVNDISEWNVNKTKKYSIFIKMGDGNSFTKDTFLTIKADRILRKLLLGKETHEIKAKNNAETKLIFKNPFKKST